MPLTGRGAGPGGVPDCVAWYKPESLTGANGSAISSWADSSPNALNASQGTAGKRPIVLAPALNGHPGASFDGTDDVLFLDAVVAGPIARNVNGFTIVAVAATSAPAGDTTVDRLVSISTGGSAGANRCVIGRNTDFVSLGGRRLDGDTFVNKATAAGTFPANTFRVLTGSFEYSAANLQAFIDGDLGVSAAWQTAGFTSDTNSVAVSLGAAAGNTQFWTGTILEVAIFDRTLTDAERAAVHSYFQDKFGIIVSDYTATGSGALTPAPATLSGSGTVDTGTVTGSGALTTASSTLSGAGTVSVEGTGNLPATPAALSASATVTASGAGALTSTAASLSGSGSLTTDGTGSLTPTAANASGAGSLTTTGSGALTPAPATLAATGSITTTGTGAVTATPATLDGSGQVGNNATGGGTLTAPPHTLTAAGTVELSGSGALAAAAATLSGTGQTGTNITGVGALTAAPATVAGAGSLTATGGGELLAAPAMLSGADKPPVTGGGALTLAPATLTGLGRLATTGAGALLAAAAILAGGDTAPGRDLTVHWPSSGRSRELSAVGRSRSLATAGRSRTLTAVPRE